MRSTARPQTVGTSILLLCAGVLALGSGSGCARLRPFHPPPHHHPPFGTEPARSAPRAEEGSPSSAADRPSPDPFEDPSAFEPVEDASPPRPSTTRAQNAFPTARRPATRPAPPIPSTLEEPIATVEVPKIVPEIVIPPVVVSRETLPKVDPPRIAAPAPSSPAAPTLADLIAESRRRVDRLANYQVRMRYQERVGGSLQAVDSALLSIHQAPRRVRIEWTDGPNKGREVLYATDLHDGLMHVRMGGVMSALPRISMKPDSPMATRSSRHPITEAGFDTIVTRMEEGLREAALGDPRGTRMRYLGIEPAEGLERPCHKIERVTPTGETWLVYLDPVSCLPTIVQANAADGTLLEHYLFGEPVANHAELAQTSAFDPDARWGQATGGGLLQRLARAAGEAAEAPAQP